MLIDLSTSVTSRFMGMPRNIPPGAPPTRFGMPPQNSQFGGPAGRFRGPPPSFGDNGAEPRGFNPRYMPPHPPHFQPRNSMRKNCSLFFYFTLR